MLKKMISFAAVAGLVLALPPAAQAAPLGMDFVTIGNPDNADDTHGNGYGGVDYTYRIGTYEVTQDQWYDYNTTDGIGFDGSNKPAVNVSWHEAAQFCNWMTSGDATLGAYAISGGLVTGIDRASAISTYGTVYAIPTEDEWYKAAYYKGGGPSAGYWDYPTDDSGCPSDKTPANQDNTPPGSANYNKVMGGEGHPVDVGSYDAKDGEDYVSDSPYGTFDQGGNVWEWNEALFANSNRGRRGGAFDNDGSYLLASSRLSWNPGGDFIGFRVSEVPEPATLALLALGGVWVLGRRRNVR